MPRLAAIRDRLHSSDRSVFRCGLLTVDTVTMNDVVARLIDLYDAHAVRRAVSARRLAASKRRPKMEGQGQPWK